MAAPPSQHCQAPLVACDCPSFHRGPYLESPGEAETASKAVRVKAAGRGTVALSNWLRHKAVAAYREGQSWPRMETD